MSNLLKKLSAEQKVLLVNSRWDSADTVWDTINKLYDKNLRIYQNDGEWTNTNIALKRRAKIRANRIFRNQESVINALIANPPQPNVLPTRNTEESKEFAQSLQSFMLKKYKDLNVKEQLRKGLRNLYFSRLIVLKPFWNAKIDDFDVRSINPKDVRISPGATKEDDAEFVIEEITDSLMAVISRFPKKAKEILALNGFDSEEEAYIKNPVIKYKEAWIADSVLFTYSGMLIGELRNPYWDWDGLLVTQQQEKEIGNLDGSRRKAFLSEIRAQQEIVKQVQEAGEGSDIRPYYFNHFDTPRKPYIFATIFNNVNCVIGQTDLITQATPLQEGIDRRKQDIDENASLVNGQVKVDSSVMSKADAQKLRFDARAVIWGKGVTRGVSREMGTPLPEFVYQDMVDSRNEIDNIMAASSAFRGEREGQETKAGRLALIDQSYLALNEMVQVVDYCSYELFNWFLQLIKVRYTEHHFAKQKGKDGGVEILSFMQDDIEDGTEIKIIEGKTLPEDRQFKYEQAQVDAEKGFISPVDYLEVAGYENPTEKAKNAVSYKLNPPMAVGMTPEEVQELSPPQEPEQKPPSVSISYKDAPPDAQLQILAQAGVQANPEILFGQKLQEQNQQKERDTLERQRTREQALTQ